MRSAFIAAVLAFVAPQLAADDRGSLKVFILAGQSNMAGHAVVDLSGPDYNGGRGTLAALASDPAKSALVAGLVDADGGWRTRDDVFVRFMPDDGPALTGPLGVGFTAYRGPHHFGPELGFGQVIGDAFEEPVLLVKTAWGGKSLYEDFRPPSAGGETGAFYRRMIEQVREALERAAEELPAARDRAIEIAGFVWYHGWNDGCDPERAVPAYEENLVHLIRDLRRDLDAPDMPVVIGELTGPWVDAPDEWGALRRAQAAAANRAQWRGRVRFVPTGRFVRERDDSPHPTHDHHEWGNAETCLLVGRALGDAMRSIVVDGAPPVATPKEGELSGYMLVPVERVPPEFNAGFSLYAAAWPLLDAYPGSRFQTGLFGTWMFAQYADEREDPNDKPKDLYSDIEGGLGWWRDTRFATATPKFIMGGVAPNFSAWANGPGAGKGRDWDRPLGKDAVAQLSPWVLWPPDGLNLAQGTCGQLFGYGYIPLPLIDAKATTAGAPVPTGGQCWTLFLNTANFKGPVAFFTPYFWSEAVVERPELAGKLLDTRPSDPNKAFQMETQWVPARTSVLTEGDATRAYARVAPMAFPVDEEGRTIVLHRLTSYRSAALPDAVRAWFKGGPAPSGALDPAHAHVHRFGDGGGSTWRLFADGTPEAERRDVDWGAFGAPIVHDPETRMTFGYRWDESLVRPVGEGGDRRVRLPEFFRIAQREGWPPRWVAARADEIPEASGLFELRFGTPQEAGEGPYVTPDAPESPFRTPGPVAGPFETTLGDGSVVVYAWYRFADQPAMLNADLTPAEREEVQRRVELIHRAWTKERTYLPPPTTGELASIDPALIVTPPKGLEIGHVPIAIRQERRGARR